MVSTNAILRLEIGVFLHTLKQHILSIVDDVSRASSSYVRILAYSAHDTNVAALLAAFGMWNDEMIEYVSAVGIELLEQKPRPTDDSKNEPVSVRDHFRLRLWHKRGWTDLHGEYRQFSACHKFEPAERGCPVTKVFQSIEHMIIKPDNYVAECMYQPKIPFSATK